MKKILTLTLIVLLIWSCSGNDEDSNSIVGNWKLTEAEFYSPEGGGSSESSIDYSNENILYNFRFNGTLVVSGGENAGYANGEYEYTFEKDYLGGLPEGTKVWLVKINSTKWAYNVSDGVMTISTSYVDGPTLKFERK
ncbi:hypothetical protein [Sinomicrobium sp. M5D2P9]